MAVLGAIHSLFLIHIDKADNIRFPFFALNTKLWAQVQGQAKMYIRTHPGAADLTVEELRERLNSNAKYTFIQSIQRQIDWIPGLTSFWQCQRRQLIQMIEQLGSPHLFYVIRGRSSRSHIKSCRFRNWEQGIGTRHDICWLFLCEILQSARLLDEFSMGTNGED